MKTIGMIIPTMDNSFFASLAHAVSAEMKKSGYTVLTCDSRNDAETEKGYYTVLRETGVSGVISVSGLSRVTEETIPESMPVVWVDRVPESEKEIPWVANDDEAAMKEAAKYLIEKGCKHILLMPGYIAEHQENPRLSGYKKALEEAGIEFDPLYVLNRTGKGSSEQETGELVMNLLRNGTKVDGIITSSDRAAFGAMKALGKVGYYSPEDVRLISFDNSPYSTMASPSITSLDRNPSSLAERACAILMDLIAGKEVQKENIISVSLVERDSTR